ncbi:putative RNA-binding protein [Cryptosporidium canis]|uniref:RNA-binding protein n=1 Tax=Cryptosporidium canis TaxID=195482 RepID=A0A9D5DNJ4_9CRYT|nr:putative RNA-binding protein [Cryptosporidium canis]
MEPARARRGALSRGGGPAGESSRREGAFRRRGSGDHTSKRYSDSWHSEYRHSSYIYISGLDLGLTEGDIAIVFSQWGEPIDVNLVRDKRSGLSRGYCFLAYEDQRSTILAVDNADGMSLLGRRIKVEHVKDYKPNCEGSYSFTGAEGGGVGVFGITRDIQTRYEAELNILGLHCADKRIMGRDGTSTRRARSLSRSISLER